MPCMAALVCRDMLVHGYGCDCTREDGSIIISAESIKGSVRVPHAPKPPTGLGGGGEWRSMTSQST